jgi:hypothetical protein
MGNQIDNLTNKTISWVDQGFSFFNKYSSLLVYGVVAMMMAKLMKFNIKMGGK